MACLKYVGKRILMTDERDSLCRWIQVPKKWKVYQYYESFPHEQRCEVLVRRTEIETIQVKLRQPDGGSLTVEDLKRLLKS